MIDQVRQGEDHPATIHSPTGQRAARTMPFIRLSDTYIDHPKFLALSASAFRLWHEGMAFCRKHQTDGLIPVGALQGFRYFKAPRVDELLKPYDAKANPLWHPIDGFGFKVHDYLEWNPSREEEQRKQADGKVRSRKWRVTNSVRDAHVQDGMGYGSEQVKEPERESEGKPAVRVNALVDEEIAERAGALVRRYGELFSQRRRGAKYKQRPNLDWTEACQLVALWPDDRLEKLAILVLTTDDPWITKTDRGFAIFAMKATWADGRLAEWEANQRQAAR